MLTRYKKLNVGTLAASDWSHMNFICIIFSVRFLSALLPPSSFAAENAEWFDIMVLVYPTALQSARLAVKLL